MIHRRVALIIIMNKKTIIHTRQREEAPAQEYPETGSRRNTEEQRDKTILQQQRYENTVYYLER